jgi:mannose-1-phosphate guanylyltransferase/phosphomannomutase
VLDPGAERLYLVDERGNLLQHSTVLLMLLESAAREARAGVVALPLHATRLAEKVVSSSGVSVRRTKCAKNALLAEAARANAIFAGNTDGGYAYPSVLASTDALYALGKVLEIIARADAPLSRVAAKLPVAHVVHLERECPWESKGAVMRLMTAKVGQARVSLIDGIKVFLDHGDWVLMLPDAEEALFHVYAEAGNGDQASQLAESYGEMLGGAIAEVGKP